MSKSKESVILSGLRTPLGAFNGSLAGYSAPELGAIVLRALVEQVKMDPNEIDEVLMGCVIPAGLGQAPARQAAKGAGFPNQVGALTINKVCGSGLKTVMLADQMIRSGGAKTIIAGGMESMTRAPFLLTEGRGGYRLGHGKILDAMILDGLWDPYNDFHMGSAGERCARNCKITREDQDAYARRSYVRAIKSLDQGLFRREIIPVALQNRKSEPEGFLKEDEEPRKGLAKLDQMASLKGAFEKNGSVTAANSSKISDGAAAVLVMDPEHAKELGLKPRFRISGHAQAALAPEDFPLAPIAAIQKLSVQTGIPLQEVDLFEINEAFAVVAEAAIRELHIDAAKTNARGGAVALGHPIGASGTRILVTLMHQLEDEGLARGIASLCLGGGEAVALMVERI